MIELEMIESREYKQQSRGEREQREQREQRVRRARRAMHKTWTKHKQSMIKTRKRINKTRQR